MERRKEGKKEKNIKEKNNHASMWKIFSVELSKSNSSEAFIFHEAWFPASYVM